MQNICKYAFVKSTYIRIKFPSPSAKFRSTICFMNKRLFAPQEVVSFSHKNIFLTCEIHHLKI